MTIPSDARRIIWRLHLQSDRRRVYNMLATDSGRARFWAESAIESNGAIDFVFINGVTTRSQIVEAVPSERFRMRYFDSEVAFELTTDGGGGTDLTLVNTGFDPNEYEEILAGWLNVLLPLKAACDFGVDLRGHDASRTWERGYVDQ